MSIHRRYFLPAESAEPLLAIEKRSAEDGTEREWISGYAAKFGVLSLDLGEYAERLHPEAFSIVAERRGRREPLETRALWNHDPNFPLARYPKTLRLSVDDAGLRYEFPVPDTTYGRDLAANIRDGIVLGSSFSFTTPPGGVTYDVENGRSVRTVMRIDSLIDVGPVTFPAYPEAEVEVVKRSFDEFRKLIDKRAARGREYRSLTATFREYLKSHGV